LLWKSQRRAIDAINQGKFKDEIIPISVPQRKGNPKIVDTDEHPRFRIENNQYLLDLSLENYRNLNLHFEKMVQ